MKPLHELLPFGQKGYRNYTLVLSLEESLDSTWKILRARFNERVGRRKEVEFEVVWNNVFLWMRENNATAEALVDAKLSPWSYIGPDIEDAFPIAIAFCIEAIEIFSSGGGNARERSWACLARCSFFLGMASGPVSTAENAASSGSEQPEQHRIFRGVLLGELATLTEKSLKSRASAIREVMPKIRDLKPDRTGANTVRGSHEEAVAITRLIYGRLAKKPVDLVLHAAFDRVLMSRPQ